MCATLLGVPESVWLVLQQDGAPIFGLLRPPSMAPVNTQWVEERGCVVIPEVIKSPITTITLTGIDGYPKAYRLPKSW